MKNFLLFLILVLASILGLGNSSPSLKNFKAEEPLVGNEYLEVSK